MDVKRLIKERPELFDYQDVPDFIEDEKYVKDMDKLTPQWIKNRLAEVEQEAAKPPSN